MNPRRFSRSLRSCDQRYSRRFSRFHRFFNRFLILLLGLFSCVFALPLPASAVTLADPATSLSAPTVDSGSQGVRPITPTAATAELSLTSMTPVITDKSGWRADVTVTNTSSAMFPAGSITVALSPYTISSASAAQDWADGQQVFETSLVLATQTVPQLKSGASHVVHLSADKLAQALVAMETWGAKPLVFSYSTDENGLISRLQTFVSRSHASLHFHANPPITLTFAVPFATATWQTDAKATNKLVTSSAASSQIVSLPQKQVQRLRRLSQLGQRDGSLQMVADPATYAYMREVKNPVQLSSSSLNGVAQPYLFDIPASLAFSGSRWKQAGVTADQWSSQTAHQLLLGLSSSTGSTSSTDSTSSQDASDVQKQSSGSTGSSSSGSSRSSSGSSSPSESSSSSKSSSPSSSSSASSSSSHSSLSNSSSSTNSAPTTPAARAIASIPSIAWEGAEAWSTDSLAAALKHGYSTVVAESAVPTVDGANQQTGRISVATSAGNVTVLIAQRELSALAAGSRTSDQAEAENTDAGRLARLVAQSSIYEAEQPYVARNLLVSFGRSADPTFVGKVFSILPQCDWIHEGSLKNLEAGMTGTSLDKSGYRDVDSSSFSLTADREGGSTLRDTIASSRDAVDPSVRRSSLDTALARLASSRATISRIGSSILDPREMAQQKDDEKSKTDNPQNLAKQNAKQTAENRVTAHEWLDKLQSAHRQLALIALTSKYPHSSPETLAAESLADSLLNAVHVMPPDHVSIFSQSARMPVTVRNNLPFAIRITVKAQTTLIATTITPSQKVHVLANAESQANFTIRAIGWSQTSATFRPVDSRGKTFGTSKSAAIYSQLSLADMSGYALIALAVILGILGLWRQFHVAKDPDQ